MQMDFSVYLNFVPIDVYNFPLLGHWRSIYFKGIHVYAIESITYFLPMTVNAILFLQCSKKKLCALAPTLVDQQSRFPDTHRFIVEKNFSLGHLNCIDDMQFLQSRL
ncbi:hypothetical protein BDF20DRAFT_890734 [Mycotypha africana]|uniref:uncharacterized protein n=1 Tax=Mycotypha africana TaxID=64632 RepID=UPI0023018581|nr:uncharacterized protein BDF20DRAFT_890734 [Mycotypha africana]KAI8970346.1 hypothetical protein BDF20DRAFT_890734 [Mycotypha africana]